MDQADRSLVQIASCRYGKMITLANDRYVSHALTCYGEFSESEVELWRGFIGPDWIVADVGANIGAHTVALARMVPQGKVAAFEPLQFLYHMLCGSLALNGITNVTAQNVAVGAESGTILVPYLDYAYEGAYGGVPLGEHTSGRPTPVVALDRVLPAVDFIKIDVEGMELDVLQGAEFLLQGYRPILYVEANEGPKQKLLIDYMRAQGYALWWHIAPHFNPDNFLGERRNDLPATPAPAILAWPIEREMVPSSQLQAVS